MRLKLLSLSAIGLLLLSACGGGGDGGEAPDTTAPSISGVAVSAPSNGKVTLTASASDNKEVTGYCFKTNATAPAASDACFTTDATQSIDTPDNDITYYVWTKDAAGNVSTVFTKALTDAVAPVVASVSVSAPISGQLTLTANASDAKGVTGYCFKTNATAPAASDACFTDAVTSIISTPQTTAHYVWAKDAAGMHSALRRPHRPEGQGLSLGRCARAWLARPQDRAWLVGAASVIRGLGHGRASKAWFRLRKSSN